MGGRRAAVLLAALLAAAVAAAPASAREASTREGAGPAAALPGLVAFTPHGLPGGTTAQRAASYRELRRAGVRAIRLDLAWHAVEPPGPPLHDRDFARLDAEIEAIRRGGLRVIGLLGYGHPDHSGAAAGALGGTPLGGGLPPFGIGAAHHIPPADPADFARYAADVARRYADVVVAWEVWNEQNEGWRFWFPREDPAAYARLLCATHAALEQVDPVKPVVFGGLFFPAVAGLPGMSATEFLQATYEAHPGVGRCYDVLAYHPYPYPFTAPELEVPIRGSVLSAAARLRAVLARHGDGARPLWITEIGWPTHERTYGVSEAKQAQYVTRMQAATFADGVPVLNWYTYGDGADPTGGANQEAHFGFFRTDGSAKPAFAALRTFTRLVGGKRFDRDLSRRLGLPAGRENLAGGGFALRYAGARERVTVLWYANESVAEAQGPLPPGGTAGPRTVAVRLPVGTAAVRVVDHLGARARTLRAQDGAVALRLGPAPLYVVERRAGG